MTNANKIEELVMATIRHLLLRDYDMYAISMDGEFVDNDFWGTAEFNFRCKVIAHAGKFRKTEYETEIEGSLAGGTLDIDEKQDDFEIDED